MMDQLSAGRVGGVGAVICWESGRCLISYLLGEWEVFDQLSAGRVCGVGAVICWESVNYWKSHLLGECEVWPATAHPFPYSLPAIHYSIRAFDVTGLGVVRCRWRGVLDCRRPVPGKL